MSAGSKSAPGYAGHSGARKRLIGEIKRALRKMDKASVGGSADEDVQSILNAAIAKAEGRS